MQRDTMYMRSKQATGKQQQAYTHGNGMQQQVFCTVNQAKAKLPARCIYTSCHVKVPTAAVSARSALGYAIADTTAAATATPALADNRNLPVQTDKMPNSGQLESERHGGGERSSAVR